LLIQQFQLAHQRVPRLAVELGKRRLVFAHVAQARTSLDNFCP
jgi:hypothetical protein